LAGIAPADSLLVAVPSTFAPFDESTFVSSEPSAPEAPVTNIVFPESSIGKANTNAARGISMNQMNFLQEPKLGRRSPVFKKS
jgi:hypothetical protein